MFRFESCERQYHFTRKILRNRVDSSKRKRQRHTPVVLPKSFYPSFPVSSSQMPAGILRIGNKLQLKKQKWLILPFLFLAIFCCELNEYAFEHGTIMSFTTLASDFSFFMSDKRLVFHAKRMLFFAGRIACGSGGNNRTYRPRTGWRDGTYASSVYGNYSSEYGKTKFFYRQPSSHMSAKKFSAPI